MSPPWSSRMKSTTRLCQRDVPLARARVRPLTRPERRSSGTRDRLAAPAGPYAERRSDHADIAMVINDAPSDRRQGARCRRMRQAGDGDAAQGELVALAPLAPF